MIITYYTIYTPDELQEFWGVRVKIEIKDASICTEPFDSVKEAQRWVDEFKKECLSKEVVKEVHYIDYHNQELIV